ncbi:MAG: glycosyltransferase family 39 protein [Eubacteriales bacterium]|nr:glycosyltransferase family 39 protein [Eubacteriales bacterium]MDD4421941.1 glycosyltransferase family 39 protein [Eubacteriales bacterium]
MKKRLLFIAHIAVWLLGTAFLMVGMFHNNVWFDESYSVGIVNHNLFDVCIISAADVHPPFYYIVLKLYSLLFGNSITSLRSFSVLCASLLAGLGITHIRKDFGEKVGFWYTTLTFLFCSTFKYANEIRMYTLAPLLVTLMCIYAYRFYKSGLTDKKNRILFLVFSILGAYTHYYALAAAGAVTFLFLLYCRKNDLMTLWKKLAKMQMLFYIPGFICLFAQSLHVVSSFWITMLYPEFIYKSLSFFLIGDVPGDAVNLTKITATIYDAIAVVIWGVCAFFVVSDYRKNRDKNTTVLLVLKVIGLVIGFFLAVSLIRPLYYVRYLTVLSGLVVLFFAFALEKINKPFVKPALILLLVVVLILRVVPLYKVMYASNNDNLNAFMTENVKDGDIIISENVLILTVISVKYPNVKMYFYNSEDWHVKTAYKAYMPGMETITELSEVDETDRRIWVLNNDHDASVCDEISANTDKEITMIYPKFVVPYHNIEFTFTLME